MYQRPEFQRDVDLGGAYVQPASASGSELGKNSTSSVSAATSVGWAANSSSAFEAGSPSVVFRR